MNSTQRSCVEGEGASAPSIPVVRVRCTACADPRPDCMGMLIHSIGERCGALAVPVEGHAVELVARFINDLVIELSRARKLFPHSRLTTIALVEEVGELCKAVLDESPERAWLEAVQVAVMAVRVVVDGDRSVDEHRRLHELGSLGGRA